MTLKLKTAPATAPITLAEVKAHLRVDHTDDDTLIQALLDAAVSHLDGYTGILGRCMISQVWELYYDAFPSGDMQIPLGNIISIDTVEYVDPTTEIYTTWADTNYEVDEKSVEGWIVPIDTWPTAMETTNAVRVTFTAGFGATATSVPAAIRAGMLLMIGNWYENREAVVIGQTVAELPFAARALIDPFRRVQN
jgi:uncharacterized phiE125 gp8 family phage protein